MRFSISRAVAVLIVSFLPQAAFAGGWRTYENARFSYRIDVPPGFSVLFRPDNGDGLPMTSDDGDAEFRIWGSHIMEGDFRSEVAQRVGWSEDEGWDVSYRRVTDNWASYSGSKGGRIFYTRAIPLCGVSVAMFRIEYSQAEKIAFDPIIGRLVDSLRFVGSCDS